jgi:hypothetical protein
MQRTDRNSTKNVEKSTAATFILPLSLVAGSNENK